MLVFVGLGFKPEDLTIEGLKEIKAADRLYVESYTNIFDLEGLKKIIGRDFIVLKRSNLEENSKFLVREAKDKKVVIMVPGDPLAATTHSAVLLEAKKREVDCKVVHNASIFSAIAECGLSLYKFGRTATVAFPYRGTIPETPYDVIKENWKLGLHTLLLLDVTKNMTPNDAMEILLKIEEIRRENVFTRDIHIVVACRVGIDPKFYYAPVAKLQNKDFGKPPYAIVVPGNLHFVEEEFLNLYKL